ncbi:MAG: VWA domain-containing protein, partial [Bacteroidetes bacterium]|nr:VWA domain-containing protein [Bacteroidota bacterium]
MSTPGFAEDNDIFGECSTTVEPNILVVIDSSGSMGTAVGSSTRIEIAREAVKSIIDDYADNNRFGIMRFHSYSGGWILAKCELKDTYILDINGDLKTGTALETALTAYKTYLKGIVSNVPANGHTPLAETLFEAGLYFAGEASEFNSGTYTSPQGYRCRKNYIILMTDGQPYSDYNELRGKSINGVALDNYVTNLYPKSGSSYYYTLDPELHNVAKLLFENDINDQLPASGVTTFVKQNVLTYPIGFGSSLGTKEKALLQDTADEGQGVGEGMGTLGDASTAANLEGVFHSIMAEIEEKKTTFASPIVPIAASSNAYAGNSVYLSMFKPDDDNSQWVGNLKKYRLNENNEFISCNSDEKILDAGVIKATARSCWSTANDGPYVAQGGAGAKLLANSSRNIIYNDASGTDGFLTFDSTNLSTLTPLVDYFPYVDDGTITMDDFVKKITMEGEDSETGWKLYDLNHSKPAIAAYANDKKYLFVGSNGGMLHCIDDFNGDEKWAFIPKE